MNLRKTHFKVEYSGHLYPKLVVEITYLKLDRKYQLIIENATILDNLDDTIDNYIIDIQKDIRQELINTII